MKPWIGLLLLTCSLAQANYDSKPLLITKGGTGSSSQSASIAVTTDGSGNLVSTSNTTATEIGYVHGVTSAIQTQINGLANQALSDLSAVAINTALLPASAGSSSLGSASLPWLNTFTEGLQLYATPSVSVLIQPDPASVAHTVTLPPDVCGAGYSWVDDGTGVMSCSAPSAMGANVALSNLSAVAINTSLLPASSGSANLGSAALPFGTSFNNFVELMGSGSGDIILSGGATPTPYTITFPSAVCAAGQVYQDNGSGVLSCLSPASAPISVSNGGDAAYAIPSNIQHVRAGTTLTANRTYTLPVCSTNIGERHEVKNPPVQTFNIILAGNGGDLIDGAANTTLEPGDSTPVVCAISGTWDIE